MSARAKITGTVTRKLGPLPLWAWVLALAGAALVYRGVRAGREQTIGGQFSLPMVRAATPSLAPAPAEGATAGGGPAMPELPSDLLAQFFAHQTATIDALTSALTGTSAAAASPEGAAPGGAAPDGAAATAADGFGTTPEGAGWLGSPVPGVDWGTYLAQAGASLDANPQSAGLGPSPYVDYSSTWASSAMLPPPQTAPQPAVQPPVEVVSPQTGGGSQQWKAA